MQILLLKEQLVDQICVIKANLNELWKTKLQEGNTTRQGSENICSLVGTSTRVNVWGTVRRIRKRNPRERASRGKFDSKKVFADSLRLFYTSLMKLRKTYSTFSPFCCHKGKRSSSNSEVRYIILYKCYTCTFVCETIPKYFLSDEDKSIFNNKNCT